MELNYQGDRPSLQEIRDSLSLIDLGEIQIQPAGEKGMILRMKDIGEEMHQEVISKLKEGREAEELRFESIGPTISKELGEKTNVVVALSLLVIVLYIAFAFRSLNYPARSWQYGLASLLGLIYNVLIPLGFFSILGYFYGLQISIPVIVALLTVVGYTINDTIVIFDRIRENSAKKRNAKYEDIVNDSISQTFSRSIAASLTTLLTVTAIYIWGGETLKSFSLALILGIFFGTFSSIFLVMPSLAAWLKWRKKI